MEAHLKNLEHFDYVAYVTILFFSKFRNPDNFQGEIRQLMDNLRTGKETYKAKEYREFQKKMFNKAYLRKNIKREKTIGLLLKHKLDILFIQEADDELVVEI